MGRIEDQGGAVRHNLAARCLVGRGPACDVRLSDPKVSAEHASLHWMGDHWELRDLGSRNGTWVDGKKLAPGERARLAEGSTLALGHAGAGFTLVDAGEPTALARHLASGKVRVAQGGLIVLPDEEQPLVSLLEDALGEWTIELEDARRPARDHEVVTVAGEAWMLELPGTPAATWEAAVAEPTLETVDLRLGVSRDEEYVEVSAHHQGKVASLPPRGSYYLLVILARARLADRAASPEEQGWIERDELCRMLGVDLNRLNVAIFRLRKHLGALGVHGISGLVARRPSTGQIRLGTARVEVKTL